MPRSRSSRAAKLATGTLGTATTASSTTNKAVDNEKKNKNTRNSKIPKSRSLQHSTPPVHDDNDSMNSRDKLHSIYSIDDSRDSSGSQNSGWTFSYDSHDQGSWVKDWGGFFPAKFEQTKRKKQFIQWKSASSRRKAANRVDAVRKIPVIPVSVSVDSSDIFKPKKALHASISKQNSHHHQNNSRNRHRHHSQNNIKYKKNDNDNSEMKTNGLVKDKIYLIPIDPPSQETASSSPDSSSSCCDGSASSLNGFSKKKELEQQEQQNNFTTITAAANDPGRSPRAARICHSPPPACGVPLFQKASSLPPILSSTAALISPLTVASDRTSSAISCPNIKPAPGTHSNLKLSIPWEMTPIVAACGSLTPTDTDKLPQPSTKSVSTNPSVVVGNKRLDLVKEEFIYDIATANAMCTENKQSRGNNTTTNSSASNTDLELMESKEELEVLRRELKVLKKWATSPLTPTIKSDRIRKNVRFAEPLVKSLNYRPRTRPEDISNLYFDEEELMELEEDRETTPRDQYEMIAQELSENRLRISIAYKNRWKPSSSSNNSSSSSREAGGSSGGTDRNNNPAPVIDGGNNSAGTKSSKLCSSNGGMNPINGGLRHHEREGHALQLGSSVSDT